MKDLDARALRNAFGSFMTGVTVVTARDHEDKPVGFTANSFASVSLDPPLLLVCPGKFLSSFRAFEACSSFAINILAEGQETVSNIFASYKGDRFSKVPHRFDDHGNALIDGAIGSFSCSTKEVIPAGDHCILIGRVDRFTHSGGRGLGYGNGQYFSLGLERAALDQRADTTVFGAIIRQGNHVLLESTAIGFRPPQIERSGKGQLRREMEIKLAKIGIPVKLGAVYSIFDDGAIRNTYVLTSARSGGPLPAVANIRAVRVEELNKQTFTTQPIADMMTRYAIEARTSSFGLYLGDGKQGDVHTLLQVN